MTKPISIPNTFASATSAIPLSQLDQDFSTLANATNDLATYSNYVADTGAADAFIVNYPANTNTSSLTTGLRLQFKAANANTGASTLNVQVNGGSIGTAAIRLTDGSALPANTIIAGALVDVMYDGTNFQIMNDPSGGQEIITNLTLSGNLTVAGTSTFTGNVTGNVVNTTTSTITNLTSSNVTITGGSIDNISITNLTSLTVDGDTTLGDASGDTLTINGTTVTTPNGLNFDSNTFVIDATNNRVGVGVASPTHPFNVVSSGNGVNSRFTNGTTIVDVIPTASTSFVGDSGGNNAIGFNTASNFVALYTGATTERMRIDSSGNVGIGTSSPTFLSGGGLEIYNSSNTRLKLTNSTTGTGSLDGLELQIGATDANIIVRENFPLLIYTNNAERMRITSTGNVGIGTSTPTGGLLSVNSTINPGTTPAALLVNMAGTAGGTATPQYGVRVTGGAYNNSTIVYGVHSELTQQLTNQTFGGYFKASGIYNNNYGIYAECVHNDTNSTTYYYGAYIKTTTLAGGVSGGTYALRVENAGTHGAASYGIYSSTVAGATNVYPLILNHAAADIFTVKSTGTVLLSGGSSAATGVGITFPATQSASSDANTLDDYEEGTWTPVVKGSSTVGTASYTVQNARYTKTGRVVFIEFYLAWNSGNGAGTFIIDGLPFTSNSSSTFASLAIGYWDNIAITSGQVPMAYVNNNNTRIDFICMNAGGAGTGTVGYDAAGGIQISGCYTV